MWRKWNARFCRNARVDKAQNAHGCETHTNYDRRERYAVIIYLSAKGGRSDVVCDVRSKDIRFQKILQRVEHTSSASEKREKRSFCVEVMERTNAYAATQRTLLPQRNERLCRNNA